jgi:lysophospholipase L1-like esterase
MNIVALGDSVAKGTGDEKGEGLTGRLKAELQQRGIRSVDVVNLGANGARTADVLARLRDPAVRDAIAAADAVVLSVGANDLAETARSGDTSLRALLDAADVILDNIASIVDAIHELNPRGRILILGAYNPVPTRPEGRLVAQYLDLWDTAVTRRFRDDVLVEVVKLSDVVVPARLSRLDHFHPGGEAYEETARRIARMLLPASA